MDIDPRKRRRRVIFSRIRTAGPIARVDLADATEISQPTVTTITAELLRKGLIEEVVPEESVTARRGRPRIALRVRSEAHRVVGLRLGDSTLSAVLTDFANTVLAERSVRTRGVAMGEAEVGEAVLDMVSGLAAEAGVPVAALSALGIGLPGVVEAGSGEVLWSPVLSARRMPLAAVLEARLGLPVFVDNDANLVAVAEKYYGAGRGVRNFLVATIEQGVGLGIVIDDEVYRGARGFASEFGHIKVEPDGALCRCGQRGCLEAYVADYALLREARGLPAFAEIGTAEETLARLLEAARTGDTTARAIVGRAEKFFAIGLANLITLFDPELIVLSGERMNSDYLVAEDVLRSVRKVLFPGDAPAPEIVVHRWGNTMWARGAAAHAIEGVAERIMAELDRDAA